MRSRNRRFLADGTLREQGHHHHSDDWHDMHPRPVRHDHHRPAGGSACEAPPRGPEVGSIRPQRHEVTNQPVGTPSSDKKSRILPTGRVGRRSADQPSYCEGTGTIRHVACSSGVKLGSKMLRVTVSGSL